MPLLLGTRASPLARWQAEWVADGLRRQGVEVELVWISTSGDQDQGPVAAIGTAGIFTKEIQRALLQGRVDLAVHSLKDLTTEAVPGLCLAAVPERADPWDVLVSGEGIPLTELPPGARIGTGSLRRQAQLRHVRPDLQLAAVRGNIDTRLRKLDEGQFDALVLAEAGLLRLRLESRITQVLPPEIVLPAVGQGALGLETRVDDQRTRAALAVLDDVGTHASVRAERALLAALHGGCMAPVAAWGRAEAGRLVLTARVLSVDGARCLESTSQGAATEPELLGRQVAEVLLEQGAGELIATARDGE